MIEIINWASFQSYKDRKPPWVRLHRSILDNFEFQSMSADARALLPMLWLLASEDKNPKSGQIQPCIRSVAFRLRIHYETVTAAILEIEKAGFLNVTGDHKAECEKYIDTITCVEKDQYFSSCSESVHKQLQNDYETVTPETETETETETYKVKTQGAKIQKAPPRSASLIELPDFISGESWFAFLDMRKKIRKPATDRACQLLIKKLTMFHNAGHDANAILDQSTVSGWQDLYELKTDYQQKRNGNTIKTIEQIKMDRTKQAMRDFVGGYDAGTGQETVCLVDG